ncbi:MAG: hypothetical protein M0R77_00470 [Gammaproteobacteria bacterium]|nr:hypothetical protein [Acholeplasmataceae bacterium]MCK9529028.1 hypothetical protein [Gammaproteobacteria bacterium]
MIIDEIISRIDREAPLKDQFFDNEIELFYHAYNKVAIRTGRLHPVNEDDRGATLIELTAILYPLDKKAVNVMYLEGVRISEGRYTFKERMIQRFLSVFYLIIGIFVCTYMFTVVVRGKDTDMDFTTSILETLLKLFDLLIGTTI